MPTSAIDSVLFRDIFGSADMRRVWSDEFRTQKYLDWEAALARAEAAVGIIPPRSGGRDHPRLPSREHRFRALRP